MDISQRQLGKMLGFKNGQYVYDWENGRSNAPIGKMRELIKILELDPRQVIDIIQLDRLDFLKSYLLPKKRKTG